MKKIISLITIMLLAMVVLAGCGEKDVEDETQADVNEVESDENVEVEDSEQKYERVITSTVAGTEILYALGVEMVAIPDTSMELPEELQELPTIGSAMDPNIEVIISLEPDIVVCDSNLEESLGSTFEEHNIEVVYLTNNSYDAVKETIIELGQVFDVEDNANEIINTFDEIEERVLTEYEGEDAGEVMILFGTTESSYLVTEHSFVGDLVEKLGVSNIGANQGMPSPYIPFSMEEAIDSNPDTILIVVHADPQAAEESFKAEFAKNDVWGEVNAVKNDRVIALDPSYFAVTGNIRSAEALEMLAEILYK